MVNLRACAGLALAICLWTPQAATAGFDPITLVVGSAFEVPRDSRYVAVGDLNDDRFDDIVTGSPDGIVTSVLSSGFGSFAGAASFDLKARLGPLVVVDLNGDSILDVAVVTEEPGGVVTAYGDGDGRFGGRRFTSLTREPRLIAAANLDGDAVIDLVVVTQGDDVVVLVNRLASSEEFLAHPIARQLGEPRAVATSDIDADGDSDVVVLTSPADGAGRICVLRNDGTGSFARFDIATEAGPVAMAVADFNLDGLADIAIAHQAEPSRLSLTLLRNGTAAEGGPEFTQVLEIPLSCPGTFGAVPIVCRLTDLASGNFNGDHYVDLAVSIDSTREHDSTLVVPGLVQAYLGLGDGDFIFSSRVNVGLEPQGLAVGQLSGEAFEDLAVTEVDSSQGPDHAPGRVRAVSAIRQPLIRPDRCFDDRQCATGHCVDGACCTVDECPVGQRCDMPYDSGECHAIYPCGLECFTNKHCESGYCVDGVCCGTPGCPLGFHCLSGLSGQCAPPGVASGCNADEQCNPPHCVDGTCCERVACEAPERCDVRYFEGECTDPDSFGPQSFGKPCVDESDCDPRFSCTDGVCCASSECGPWHRCNIPGREGTCEALPAFADRCEATPVPRANGETCGLGVPCASANCLDGVCCASPSCPVGQRCNLESPPGQCATPPLPEEICEDDADCATGNCDQSLPLPQCGPPRTPTPSHSRDDGCAISDSQGDGSLWLFALAIVALRRGVRTGTARRPFPTHVPLRRSP